MIAGLLAIALPVPPPVTVQTLEIPGPNRVHIARIDLNQPGLDLLPVAGFDNLRARERPSRIHERLKAKGLTVLAVINADFGTLQPGYGGPRNSPHSLLIRDGVLWNSASTRPSLARLADGRTVISTFRTDIRLEPDSGGAALAIERFNHWQPFDRAALFGPQWVITEERPINMTEVQFSLDGPIRPNGRVLAVVEDVADTRGGVVVPPGRVRLQVLRGSPEAARFAVGQRWTLASETEPFPAVRQAIGGGPTIVTEGRPDVRAESEGFAPGFSEARHPRSAIGLDRSGGVLILAVVDGRRPGRSIGVTLPELAEIMIENGAWVAMNADGGGSSTLIVDGKIINEPSDESGERTTTSSLAVVVHPPTRP
ncbi:MAG: phosphodiester glycosidase family protein [Fimbriimonadaceae bacterium]|nr:phosphodiester glycosidase family protein [Fimbriimonadaceae bacterium]